MIALFVNTMGCWTALDRFAAHESHTSEPIIFEDRTGQAIAPQVATWASDFFRAEVQVKSAPYAFVGSVVGCELDRQTNHYAGELSFDHLRQKATVSLQMRLIDPETNTVRWGMSATGTAQDDRRDHVREGIANHPLQRYFATTGTLWPLGTNSHEVLFREATRRAIRELVVNYREFCNPSGNAR